MAIQAMRFQQATLRKPNLKNAPIQDVETIIQVQVMGHRAVGETVAPVAMVVLETAAAIRAGSGNDQAVGVK